MTQQQILDILTKLSRQQQVSQQELTDLSREILNRSASYINTSLNGNEGNDEPSFDINTLKKYIEDLVKVEDKIKQITDAKGEGVKYTKAEQKELDKQLKLQAELNKRISERRELDYLIKKLNEGINKDYELQERALGKQVELQNLQKKAIKEGLTLEEKRYQLLSKFGEKFMNTDMFKKGVDQIKKGLNDAKDAISKFNEAWSQADQAAANYTKRIGGSAASMEKLRKSTINFMEANSIGVKFNTSMEELIKLQADYNAGIGRSIDLTNSQMTNFAAMKQVLGDQAAIDFSLKLENFGLNPDEVGDRVGKMFSNASKSGVAFEKWSKNVLDNIKLAQNYNFKNGVDGLISMAKKASEIKLDMQQVARFADKVSTLEGAVTAGANLSVLGGPFAQYGNPLTMLYEGLNDMEGLQDRVVKMFGNLGKWDYQKGQVDVSVFNKQRMKAAAEATGMDFSALMESVNANARRNIVSGKIGNKFDNDEEFKDLLLNKAQLDKEGNAFVTINGQKKDVTTLTEQDKGALKSANRSDSDKLEEIAINTRGYKDTKEGFKKQGDIASASLNELSGIGKLTKQGMDWLGNHSGLLKAIKAIDPVMGITNALLTTINGSVLEILSFMRGGAISRMLGGNGSVFGGGGGGLGGGRGAAGGRGGFGIGGRFGSKYNYTRTANGRYRNAAGRFISKPSAGMRFMKGVGQYGALGGMAISGAGYLGDALLENSFNENHTKGDNITEYTLGKTATSALEWGGTGASLGSLFGPLGALIGGGLGLLGGGIFGGINANRIAKKEHQADFLRRQFGAVINDPDQYSMEELMQMHKGEVYLSSALREKMMKNGDSLGSNSGAFDQTGIYKKYSGYEEGVIGIATAQKGTVSGTLGNDSLSATVQGRPINLAGGEAIINAEATKDPLNQAVLSEINNGGNPLNVMAVEGNKQQQNNQAVNETLSVNVNIGGTITVNVPNHPAIDTAQIQKIIEDQFRNPAFIDSIINKTTARGKGSSGRIEIDKSNRKIGFGIT